ncbi:MAG: glycosyltransferase [Sphingomicrobium sp.]
MSMSFAESQVSASERDRGKPAIDDPLSILLLARSLETGGAERQLVELARGLRTRGHSVTVAAFYKRGPLVAELESASIPLIDLRKRGRWDVIGFFWRARKLLRKMRPDVLYSFLGGANVIAALVARAVPKTRLVWSVRSADVDLSKYDWLHTTIYLVERAISGAPDLIIANSNKGMDYAIAQGFPAFKFAIVPNGIDVARFSADPQIRSVQRASWGVADEQIAIGTLARLDPMKDHVTFLHAAALAARQRSDLRFLCIGDGAEEARLKSLVVELDITDRVTFTGQADASAALNALDIACSSSITEGFPNAIAEAMACGLPCVVTDVGDSAFIVGDNGVVVPRSDPKALAAALLDQASRLVSHDAARARARIVGNFSVDAMIDRTAGLLQNLSRHNGRRN